MLDKQPVSVLNYAQGGHFAGLVPRLNMKKVTPIVTQLESIERVREARKWISAQVIDRSEETNGMFVSLIARSSMLMLGPYGTSKTRHVRLFGEVTGLRVFDQLISKSIKPEAIFGPVDVPSLAKSIYRFKTEGYAPSAELVFFDEIFKANGLVLNQLLWLLNERQFRNGDLGLIDCPIQAFYAASNEVPSEPELGPVYDRFLLRTVVGYLRTPQAIRKMIETSMTKEVGTAPKVEAHHIQCLRDAASKVELPSEISDKLIRIRQTVQRETQTLVSDRRIVQTVGLMRALAALRNKPTVTDRELGITGSLFWDKPEHASKVSCTVQAMIDMVSDASSYEEAAVSAYEAGLKSGDLETTSNRLLNLANETKRLTTTHGRKVYRRILELQAEVASTIAARNKFVVVKTSTVDDGDIYKVLSSTALLWSPAQLRSLGFKLKRKTGVWWQPAPASSKKFKLKAKKTIGVVPHIRVV